MKIMRKFFVAVGVLSALVAPFADAAGAEKSPKLPLSVVAGAAGIPTSLLYAFGAIFKAKCGIEVDTGCKYADELTKKMIADPFFTILVKSIPNGKINIQSLAKMIKDDDAQSALEAFYDDIFKMTGKTLKAIEGFGKSKAFLKSLSQKARLSMLLMTAMQFAVSAGSSSLVDNAINSWSWTKIDKNKNPLLHQFVQISAKYGLGVFWQKAFIAGIAPIVCFLTLDESEINDICESQEKSDKFFDQTYDTTKWSCDAASLLYDFWQLCGKMTRQ